MKGFHEKLFTCGKNQLHLEAVIENLCVLKLCDEAVVCPLLSIVKYAFHPDKMHI